MKKVAVVTGSARGLGASIAFSLAENGYRVVVHYRRSRKEAENVLKKIKESSAESMTVSGDLRDEKQVDAIFEDIFGKFKRVDLLVNNVGNFVFKKFSETTNSEFRAVTESNVYSTLYCSRAVLPYMRRQKSGQIINIGVVGAERFIFRAKSVPYFWAKNGVYVLTKVMAHEEAKNGIRVNMISPASLTTDIFKAGDFPMGRSASYEDVTCALLFLISDDAYYINGANLEVAGAFIPGMT